jgi:hypothetical protein
LGAQAAQAFDRGDIASGLGAIAAPFAAEQGRKIARQERMGDFRAMEGFRTDENIRQLMEAQNIKTEGGTSGQVAGAAQRMEAGMPAAGTELFPRIPDSEYAQLGPEPFGQEAVTALGPPRPNMPGPGPMPNTKYDWNPAQNAARMRVLQDYSNRVDNPNERSKYTPEQRQLLKESAERELENIRVQLMPDRPKPMIPGPGGQAVPAQLGVNTLPDGSKAILQNDGTVDYRDAPRDFTKNFTADWTLEQTAAYQRKQVGPDYDKLRAAGHSFFVQPNGDIEHIDPGKGAEPFKWDWGTETEAAEKFLVDRKGKVDDKYVPSPDEIKAVVRQRYEMAREFAQEDEAGKQLRGAMQEVLSRSPVQPISEETASEIARAVLRIYGPDKKNYPKDVRQAVERLDARMRMQTGRR